MQHELADARLVLTAALAARDGAAAAPVLAWMTTNNVEDATLAALRTKLAEVGS